MLSRRDDTWDLQFTEDGNYLLNFGWIYARPSNPVIDLYRRALAEYISNNMWDVRLSLSLSLSSPPLPCPSKSTLTPSLFSFLFFVPDPAARVAVQHGSQPRSARTRSGI